MKRGLAGLLSLAMLLAAFSGCAANNTTNDQPAASAESAGQTGSSGESLSSDTDSGEKPMTISYISTPSVMDDYFSALVEAYTELHPHITFTKTLMETEQHRSTVPNIMSGQGAPDFTWLNYGSGDVQALVKIGVVEPLDRYYEQYGWWDTLPEQLKTHKIDDIMYHFSLGFSATPLTFYNKKVFSELGLAIPTTYEELVALSQTVRLAGYQPYMMGDRDGWPGFHMYQSIAVRTVPLEDYNKVLYFSRQDYKMADYPGFAKAFDIMRDMEVQKVWGDGVIAMNDDEASAIFKNGGAAMYESGTWAIAPLREALGDDLDYFWFPTIDSSLKPALTVSYPDEFIMSALIEDEKKDAIAQFIDFCYSKDGMKIIAANGGTPIATNLTVEDLEGLVDPIMARVIADFSDTETYNFTDEIVTFWGNELYAELRQKVQECISGQSDSATVVGDLDALAERIRTGA